MATDRDTLKSRGIDYLLASIEDGQLVLEPMCSCGTVLEEDYHCPECDRDCKCRFVACIDPQALAIVEKLISGNPNFRNFEASLIDK
jgi:hypothetical protein